MDGHIFHLECRTTHTNKHGPLVNGLNIVRHVFMFTEERGIKVRSLKNTRLRYPKFSFVCSLSIYFKSTGGYEQSFYT